MSALPLWSGFWHALASSAALSGDHLRPGTLYGVGGLPRAAWGAREGCVHAVGVLTSSTEGQESPLPGAPARRRVSWARETPDVARHRGGPRRPHPREATLRGRPSRASSLVDRVRSDEMKAILYRRYGGPDVLALEDIPTPVPKDDEVLIRVRAASVNPLDWHYMRGRPSLLRLASGLRQPKDPRLGADVAGHVTTVGQSVSVLKAGDEVFGTCRGSFAEYVCAKEAALVKKPVNMSFEQAAATPIGAFSALQALRDKGRLRPGQSVLINGAGGGVGTFAVQIATVLGGEVTGVCSTLKV